MKKTLFSAVLLLLAVVGYAQLNNSWIDYSKTYYKFRLANDTLCRINQSALPAAIAGTPAQNFQLWRNGQEVRLYTSVATGPLASGDYIEFWGLMNDGKPDKGLYRNADYQLSEKYSLETDTVTYYLTVNPAGNNLRYVQSPNNIAGNVLPAETYFMRRVEANYKSQINKGYAAVIGEYVYSSSYDIGEGWTSNEIFPCCALSKVFSNLNVYTAGPPNSVMFTIGAVGNALYSRELVAKFYNTVVYQIPMPFFNYRKDTVRNLPLSLLASPTDLPVSVNGNSSDANDRIVVSCISVTYPATFNFNNEKNFYFELKANPAGNYLVINNFNSNGIAPVLYDYNNAKRYLGDIAIPGQVRFVLPASTDSLRKFNLMSQDASNISIVNNLTTKTFTNYSIAANQGNYLIISNPVLYNDGSGVNNVDLYRQYRSSVTGGGFNAKIYDINELTEQFGFGIKRHPSGIRDFIRYAYNSFATTPKYAFIIGRAVSYEDYTILQSNPVAEQLNLVQTFGYPASDILLSAAPGTYVPLIPIGRLGAVNGSEVGIYYRKMIEYEAAQQSTSQTIADKAWMKNYLHTIGGSDSLETADFTNYMNTYKLIAEDSLMGAHVETYAKSTVAAIDQQQSARIEELFHIGLTYVKYFGHSSSNELAINLNYPENYQNAGKYPFMHVSGCTVGNFFTYNPGRLIGYAAMSLSEKYIFLNQKGGIGFLGSTHFGIAPFLHVYNTSLYHNICRDMYGNTIGNQIKNTMQAIGGNPALLDFYTRIHLEEVNLQGDPALKINSFAKPDYVIEDQLVKFTPNIITVADASFNVNVKMMNIGRAIKDSMRVIIKQQLPAGTIKILYNQMVPATINTDSVILNVPINPITDKGLNKLIVSLDDGNRIDELSETNNTLTKDFYIFEDELNPVSPYNYSIVGQQNINFYASTANALSSTRQFVMEIDTTELFNSSFKKTYNASGTGGVIQFAPTNLTFSDSTVYYWRTSIVPTGSSPTIWNTFSFVYLANGTPGFNQSHYFQHLKSSFTGLNISADRKWKFNQTLSSVQMKTGVYPTAANQAQDFEINVDGGNIVQSVCTVQGMVVITAFNPIGLVPMSNVPSGPGLYGSDAVCGPTRQNSFNYTTLSQAKRISAVNFLDQIPNGYYVVVMNVANSDPSSNTFVDTWKADTAVMGSGNSLYHRLKNAGFSLIDSFTNPRAFSFIYKKGDNTFTPHFTLSDGMFDKINSTVIVPVGKGNGTITSPIFGPARTWSQFHWRGAPQEVATRDSISFKIIGVTAAGAETTLYTVDSATKDFNISAINALQYPYLRLKMFNQDSLNGTPYQLRYWRLNYTPIPEGAVSPNILFNMKDTVDQGEPINFKLAFKNISPTAFDSTMKINITITDKDNQIHVLPVPRGKKLIAGDTLVVSYTLDTKLLPGNNTLFVDVNPNNDQVEQFHFNNVLYKDFFVRADTYNPLLDITFDGVHILNKDIVAAKPRIVARLKDESRFLALSDTALIKVQVRFPDGSLHNYSFGDTMHFTPANLAAGENAATIDLTPTFTQDGEYELIVTGKDVVGNKAGALDYHVIFTVISKAMISNLLNYPNPFTSSTAFVFTITGNEVPQNIRIQVLTITGKVVREITKDELGPLHVGRNITEFKWDGTDMYGSKLANGVYLYRVLTNLNGKSLEKYKADGDNTDKFFNKGYGKMVILR